jgi:RNA polymerase sigma-70 factor (ECF subfamily)
LSLISKTEKELAVAQTDIHRDIIEQSKAGNSAAQYRLYKLYAKAMFNIAYRMMDNREEAEDMLQEAFSHAFAKLKSFRYESSFGSWIKCIVINHCLNEIKRRKADLQFFDDMSAFNENMEDEGYESGLSVDNVRKSMEFLPSGSKMIFSLYLLEGYDHREISQILNISESNSKSQYMRAKRKVKEVFKKMSHETR